MKNLYLLLLSALVALAANGQQSLPPVYEIKTDTASYLSISDKNWQKLEDFTGKLSIEQVTKPPVSSKFHFNKSSKFYLSVYAYWYRYSLKNDMAHDAKIIIYAYDLGYRDLYTFNDKGTVKHYQTGWLVPWSARDGLKMITSIKLVLKPGERLVIYQRDRITTPFFIKPQLVGPLAISYSEIVIQGNYVDNDGMLTLIPLVSIVIGISLLAAIFNLSFFKVVREKPYLYFSLFLIFFSLDRFFGLGGSGPLNAGTTTPLFKEMPYLLNITYFVSDNFLRFYLICFVTYYLEIFTHYPKLKIALKPIFFFCLFFSAVSFFTPFLPDGWYKMLILCQVLVNDTTMFLVFLAFLFYLKVKGATRVRVLYVLPFLFLWGCLGPVLDTYYILLSQFFEVSVPAWVAWVAYWWVLIELGCISWLVLFFSYSLFQRFRHMQTKIATQALEREKERSQLIEEQKVELEKTVEERTAELKQSLIKLKATQSQLIQSEKMASLGELTAGIAHEIQNPLNFVNNFSEVNTELIDELKLEIAEGNYEEVNAIADDIKENQQKINMHGKRADGIVKGMLQHSKVSTGSRESTNINALAEEYMRLSYHGLRSKDKSFIAELVTHFDPNLPKVNVVPQDIGRVMLNLFNNAFYAINQKQKIVGEEYKAEITVTTLVENNHVLIKVKDNGVGIPDAIKDKIMQPFFTTKPTGDGTGLGLSLTYDMLVKGHGGSIVVDSKEGEFTEFVVTLPLNL